MGSILHPLILIEHLLLSELFRLDLNKISLDVSTFKDYLLGFNQSEVIFRSWLNTVSKDFIFLLAYVRRIVSKTTYN